VDPKTGENTDDLVITPKTLYFKDPFVDGLMRHRFRVMTGMMAQDKAGNLHPLAAVPYCAQKRSTMLMQTLLTPLALHNCRLIEAAAGFSQSPQQKNLTPLHLRWIYMRI